MIYEKSKAKSITADRLKIRNIVQSSIKTMADVVGATLGPGGRCVIIERDGLSPLVTKDGVTVAKTLGLANAEANLIIESAKEICLRTAKQAGDGTTTAIVLASAITEHGLDFLEKNPKYNPQRMVSELNGLYNSIIVPFLKQHAKPVKERHELINVAKISANGDAVIATAAVEAVIAAGEDGQVLIEEEDSDGIRVETIDGCIVTTGLKDLGSIGLVFINDRGGQQAKMDNGLVFLYDGTMNDLKVPAVIQTALEGTENYGKPILVFAHGFSDVVLSKFAQTTKGGYSVIPVKTPLGGVANSRSMFLFDMAAYTGARVFDPGNLDMVVNDDEVEEGFGYFQTAKINLFECFLTADTNSEEGKERIDARIAELKSIMQIAPNDRERMFAKAAISKLTGGVSTIWVGGGSELEAREKKARVEDAVEAVRSAIAEGIIPGGCGVHLVLSDLIAKHPDKVLSWDIMIKALRAPFEVLLSNCGEDFGDVWNALEPYIAGKQEPPKFIFDANAHKIVDPEEAGIIEPAKVCRVSLGNALSVASLLITLGGIVVTPRDSGLENQLALSKQAFKDMMDPETGFMGQE
jgi:chaperonin GroEL